MRTLAAWVLVIGFGRHGRLVANCLALAARAGHPAEVVVIQRVRVRWGAGSRGAAHATARRRIPQVLELPALPNDEVVVHDVFHDEALAYRPTPQVGAGPAEARAVGLWIEIADDGVVVERLPGWAAYPIRRAPARLFTLKSGQVGRYHANFRFTGCACAPQWYYEQWTVHVAHAEPRPDLFLAGVPVREVDDRVHLYGGALRRRRTAADGSR
jgi:hypothetical protein